ncbi:MAG: aldehyde dehydrogenase family protein [Pseudomonadota bacterium]
MNASDILQALDIGHVATDKGDMDVRSPTDGALLGTVTSTSPDAYDDIAANAVDAFRRWRDVPAPQRGEFVRRLGEALRERKDALGALVTLESGKIYQEGLGEVQEMIDICDFAVGLSRQLYGLTMPSERPGHRIQESWLPMGPVGVISAFNFPVAVWSWNTALAIVCGDSVIWKPSEKTPLTALACQKIFEAAAANLDFVPEHLSQVIFGDRALGELLVNDSRLPVISATGSTRMGRQVAPAVAQRFGRSILELGGNNAMIVTESADLELAIPAIVFGAVGTAGQRCTSTRRVIIHESRYGEVVAALEKAYSSVRIGDPLAENTLVGPLVDQASFEAMQDALSRAPGKVTGGERVLADEYPDAFYVAPALVDVGPVAQTVQEETFAPILYLYSYQDLGEAIRLHNDVPQGLSSAIFTRDVQEAERFISASGSDCGIANVNIGTSGAEIGGAFGGEKDTGGGRESGSDAWKGYMRRSTSTINRSAELPLAQGIRFDL